METTLTLGNFLILTPVPPLDYRTKEEVIAAWESGSMFQRANGKWLNKETFKPIKHNFIVVEFRFNKGTRLVAINPNDL